MAFLGYKKWSNIIKETLINCDTFEEAVEYLQTVPSIKPCYLTVCGTDKGVKITRDRFKARLDWVYADNKAEESFFDVQTNCDSWKEPLKKDNGRLEAAREMILATGFENMSQK